MLRAVFRPVLYARDLYFRLVVSFYDLLHDEWSNLSANLNIDILETRSPRA